MLPAKRRPGSCGSAYAIQLTIQAFSSASAFALSEWRQGADAIGQVCATASPRATTIAANVRETVTVRDTIIADMHSRYVVAFACTLAAIIAAPASAQERGQIGVAMGYPGSI